MAYTDFLNNLAITSVGNATSSVAGKLIDYLNALRANSLRDSKCRFYYSNAGGSILRVVTKGIVGGMVKGMMDDGVDRVESLLFPKSQSKKHPNSKYSKALEDFKEEKKSYGKFKIKDDNGKVTGVVYALDDWGCISTDALMLGIDTDQEITISQSFPDYGALSGIETPDVGVPQAETNEVTSNTLVWYDTTAIVSISSKKNLVSTRVQGRDYSRKELVSNGDIEISVSGQITSGYPDIYPSKEVQKFLKVMQYKGVVQVNNQILDQLGIQHISILDFNLPSTEGYKSVQKYSFSALGLQPAKEIEINTQDTITIIPAETQGLDEVDVDSGWKAMFKNQLEGLKSMAVDVLDGVSSYADGQLENLLDNVF